MNFVQLKDAADRLRSLIRNTCRQDLICDVSVEEPASEDELGFYKTVLWSYVFWNEACPPVGRYLLSSLRNTAPDIQRDCATTFNDVGNLRTRLAHNLKESSGDQRKLNQSSIWMLTNGGEPPDWAKCCGALSVSMAAALNALSDHWQLLNLSPDDSVKAVERLLKEVQQDWPVHTFDPVVDDAARTLGISGLDIVAYRKSREEAWKKLAKMFQTRAEAEAALRRVIITDLTQTFGSTEIHSSD